jgi:hypothetical protein
MSIIGSNILAGASGQAGGGGAYEIKRSVRLNAPDSSFLSRTPGTAGNRKTWTWAGWVKRSKLGTLQDIFEGYVPTDILTFLRFGTDDKIRFASFNASYQWQLDTTQVFRDVSSWYHIVVALDTTQATSSNRAKIYVNGVQVTDLSTANYPTLNADYYVNGTNAHYIGKYGTNDTRQLAGYLADIHFIDGQALDPTSFGEFDTNGVWQPIDASGLTYGANGFRLPFSDNSTAAALGTDTSGNGNTWTVNNITPSDGTRYTYNIATMTNEKNDATDSLSHLFDGLLSTTCASINGTDGTITFSPAITGITSLRIHAQGKPGTGYFVVNGTEDYGNSIGDEVYQWITITGVSSLSTIFIRHVTGYSKTTVQAIEVNGVILTDGAAGDSLVDSPTNGSQVDTGVGGEVVGNYATLNPLDKAPSYSLPTLSNGNLDVTSTGESMCFSTIRVSSGKWFIEYTVSAISGTGDQAIRFANPSSKNDQLARWSASGSTSGLNSNPSFSSYTAGDVLGVAVNMDTLQAAFYKNGVQQGTGFYTLSNYSAGDQYLPGWYSGGSGASGSFNFGQRQWAYAAPAGFKALCTTNLPEPTIADGSTVMDVKLYTGNGSTQAISGLNFSPDFVWIKARNTNYSHQLIDIIRGGTRPMFSDRTDAEGTYSSITAFNSDGYTVSTELGVNGSGTPFVAWTWDAGTSTVTNTAGSITSQVRANASSGFSIVTWTGTMSPSTIGHGLGVAPQFIIVKRRSSTEAWVCYHRFIDATVPADYDISLNSTAARRDYPSFGDTLPTSTVFSVGATGATNETGETYVAYCFAPVAGYSAFGRYTGNGSADGPFVYTGFRVAFLLYKKTSSATDSDWVILDRARNPSNGVKNYLFPNDARNEGVMGTGDIDFTANGYKIRATSGAVNASGGTYIYYAVAESPFQYARAR